MINPKIRKSSASLWKIENPKANIRDAAKTRFRQTHMDTIYFDYSSSLNRRLENRCRIALLWQSKSSPHFLQKLELAIFSMSIAVSIGILLGVESSKSYNKPKDHLIRIFGIVTYAIPVFFLGMIFQIIFGVGLRWLPVGGRTYPTMEPVGLRILLSQPPGGFTTHLLLSCVAGLVVTALCLIVLRVKNMKITHRNLGLLFLVFLTVWGLWTIVGWHFISRGELYIKTGLYTLDSLLEGNFYKFVEALRYLFLPSLTLGLVLSGVFIRLTRSNMLETLRLDFVTAARARGLKETMVTYSYAFRNAFLPILTMMGLQFATLLAGAVLTETTFSWPGLGRYIVDRINLRLHSHSRSCCFLRHFSFSGKLGCRLVLCIS